MSKKIGPPYKILPEEFEAKYLKVVNDFFDKEKRIPTQVDVAKALNISRRTLQYKLKQTCKA